MKRCLLLIVIIFFGKNVFGQITPPGPISLCLGDSIVLTAPVGTTYQWFKNGSNLIGDTLQTYTAKAAGNYAVKVNGVTTAPVVVNINPKPAIPFFTFIYTPFQCSELPVNFNVTSPVGGITYTWNFGDGQTATGPNVTHTYNALGNGTQAFNATVTATNSFNCSAVSTGQLINLKQHPDAAIADFQSQTPFTNCGTPTFDLVIDNISTTQSTNAQYQIDWGDGSPLFTTAILPTTGTLHTYTTQGYFYLILKITGQNGCISTKTYTVFNGSNPGVGLSSNGNTVLQCLPATDTFFITYPSSNPPGTTYTISYNDGSPDVVYSHPPPSSFTHTFTTSSCNAVNTVNPYSFYVKIRVQNPCGYLDGGVEPITTITRPSAAIGISPDTVNCINTTVYFTNTSSNGQVVQNGVCNSGGIINWIITPITGSPTGWAVTSGIIGNPNPNTNPLTWGSQTIGVDFNAIGTYSIKIIVRNFSAAGTTCRIDSITRIVCISTLPTTGFKLNKNKGCLPLSVNATDTSTFLNNCRALLYLWKVYYSPANCGLDSSWSFTGGTSDTSKNPKFIFKKAGLYTIEQTVISPCGNLTNSKDINVFKSPTFTLPPDTTSCGPTKYDPWVILPGCDTLTLSYSWTFDGIPVSSILPNPDTVLFTGVGSHPITLTATNACGVAKDTQLVIINDIPDVIPNKDTTVCPGTTLGPIVFSSSSAGAVFNWTNSNPAIGLSASGNGDIPSFIATNATASPDTGLVIVFSSIPNCGTSLPDTFLIIVKPTITDTTRDTICNNQLPYLWRGISYTSAGTYTVNISNPAGCDTLAALILDVINPQPGFTTVTICPAQIPYVWNGTNYTGTGTYTITLLTTAGCDSSATLNLTISDTIVSDIFISICTQDTPYVWNGRTYTSTATDSIHLKNALSCDSIAYLHLTVNVPTASTTNSSTCSNLLPFNWNNKDYYIAGTYKDTLLNAAVCDSIATLVLTIYDTTSSNTDTSICPSDLPFSWNGNTYSFAIIDSVTLTNSNGCDSIARLFLRVKDTTSSITIDSVCSNKYPYSWNGNSYTGPGTYNAVLVNSQGCDSTAVLILRSKPISNSTTRKAVCRNQLPFVWNGKTYSAAGTYRDTLLNRFGCDSIAKLILTVNDTSFSITTISICPSQLPYSWNSHVFSSGGFYLDTFVNAAGCDSIAKLQLIIKDTSSSLTTVSICPPAVPYNWNGNLCYYSGVYTFIGINSVGCDSFARLQLTIKDTTSSTSNISVCRESLPFLWNGTLYSLAGTYLKVLQNYQLCDSFATLNLSIKQGTTNTTVIKICKSQTPFIWNGRTYSITTIDSIKYAAINGCDSISRLDLTVYPDITSTTNISVCEGNYPFLWNGSTFDSAGTYVVHLNTYHGCDSAAKLVLRTKLISRTTTIASVCANKFPYIWHTRSYYAAGVYLDTLVNAVGCDSVNTLVLSVKLPTRSLTQISICPSQLPYTWNATTYNAATTDSITLVNSAGCDSMAVLVLTVRASDSSTTNASVCSNKFPYNWNGNNYYAPGIYRVSFTNTQGCDSIAILNLAKVDTSVGKLDTAVCRNRLPFVWHGNAYPLPGSYQIKLVNTVGCDSVVTLNLSVNDTSVSLTDSGVCQSAMPVTWNGFVYNLPGDYTALLVNVNGCDSFAHLHLHIKPNSSSVTVKNICPSALPFLWNGNLYTAAGIYQNTLINSAGCDSVARLVLSILDTSLSVANVSICPRQLPYLWNGLSLNTSGTYTKIFPNSVGCDSTAMLVLTVKKDTASLSVVKICATQFPYTWNGIVFTTPKLDSAIFTAINGCDSVARLNLIKKDTTGSLTDSSICDNIYPFAWNGNTYNSPGFYTVQLVNAQGCDSMARLILRSIPISRTTDIANVCSNKLPYTWHGNVYTTPGIYYDTLANARGCDSIVKLVINIKPISFSTTQLNICPSQLPYTWNGNVYTTGGSYKDTLMNAAGCDSVVTLLLNVKNNSSSIINVTACKKQLPYLWNGNPYSQAGTYKDTIPNSAGCDSIMTLNLIVKPDTSSFTTVNICPSQLPYHWNGQTYTGAKVDSVLFAAANGCDSVAHLNLIIKDTTGSLTDSSICENIYPFAWNGNTYNLPDFYTVRLINSQGCDSMARLILRSKLISRGTEAAGTCHFPYVWHGHNYNNAGIYYDTLLNVAGCDSIVKLVLNATSPTSSVTNLTICSNQLPYSWNTIVCNGPGIYHDTIPNSVGCDSAMILYLTTKPATQSNTTITICPLQLPYTWNGVVYTAGGIDTVHLTNHAGCDSAAIIDLIVKSPLRDSVTANTCTNQLPYFWNGNFYFLTGYYSDTLHNIAGCDSIATLHLIVNPTSASDTYDTACRNHLPFLWNGNVYNATGVYTVTLSNTFGCDSVATLHLKVFSIDTTVVYYTICQSQLPFAWNGNIYNAAGTYQVVLNAANRCDSVARLILSVTPNPPSPNGTSNSPVCEGTTLTLFSQTMPGAAYSWSGPDTFRSTAQNPNITNATTAAAGNYYVTATVNGCSKSDTVPVNVIPKSIGGNTNSDSAVCSGNNTGTIYLTGNTGVIASWDSSANNGVSWTSVANITTSLTYNNLLVNTWYRAVVQTGNCPAVYSDTTKITIVPNASVANAGPDQKLCNLPVAALAANNPIIGTGQWSQFSGPSQAVFTNKNLYNTTATGLQTNSTYRFVWTITSPGNCNNNSDTVNIVIRPKITTANAGPDQTVCNFSNTYSVRLAGNIDATRPYENGFWTLLSQPVFSADTISNTSSPSTLFSFNKPGTYKLIWTIGNDALSCPASKDTVIINVYDKPVAAFRASPSQFCLGQPDTVFNSSLHANAYEWSWGDGTTSTFVSGQHLYQTAGNFTIVLVAKYVDALARCTDTTKRQVVVVNKIRAQMNVATGKTCVPYQLVANAVNSTGAASIQWKIFDHNISPGVFYATGSSVSHIYNLAGSDSVRLIVYSTNGCADSTTYKFTVYDVPVTVSQPLNIIKTCSHDTTIKFTANTSYTGSDPLIYQWFIDSSVAGNVNPFIHRFITPADSPNTVTYTISVLVENTGRCGDTSFQGLVNILPLPPISIKVSPSLIQQQPDYTFNFADTSAYDSLMLYQWNLGDKNLQTRDGKTLSYSYSDTGKYKVRLLKTNLATGCQATDSVRVSILPVPGYLQIPNAICPGCHENALRQFLPLGKGLKEYHLRIYNKWGQKIFETSALNPDGSPKEPWDGRWAVDHTDGGLLQQNAYTWQAEGLYINGTEWKGMVYPDNTHPVKTGFITIIR